MPRMSCRASSFGCKIPVRRASGGSLDAVKNGCSVLSGGVEGNAEQDGEEDDLQDVAVDEGSDDAGWHAVGEELPPLLALAGSDELVGSVGALDLVGDGVNPDLSSHGR